MYLKKLATFHPHHHNLFYIFLQPSIKCQLKFVHFLHSSVDKESVCNAGDLGLIPGSGRSPGERKWQHIPVHLPGESHERRSLAGFSSWVTQSRTQLSN